MAKHNNPLFLSLHLNPNPHHLLCFGTLNFSLNAWRASWLVLAHPPHAPIPPTLLFCSLSFSFVRSWLNLSLARSSVNILRAACCPVLIYLFVLLVWSWWQLHIITNLLGFGRVGIWKTLQLSIVLDNLIAEEHFINDFVIRSWVLEERIVHVASSGWVDSQVVPSSLIFQDGFLDVFFIFQVCSLFQWLVEGRILLGVFTDKFIDLLH